MFTEDKQAICDALYKTLKLTRAGSDIKALWYDKESETVEIVFKSGLKWPVNVNADSGSAMIRDVMNYI